MTIIIFGAVCILLLVALFYLGDKTNKLTAENYLMKGRMEAEKEKTAGKETVPLQEKLTAEGIEEAVRHAGYVPDRKDTVILFMVSGDHYFVDTARLPAVFLIRQFSIDTNEWDIGLLRHAAHIMSDEIIIIKADIDDDDEATLRFIVAALDGNYASFRDNLTTYISLITEGHRKMNESYEQLLREKNEAEPAVTQMPSTIPGETKFLS